MKQIKVNIEFTDNIDEGFDKHLTNGEDWAFDEYERRLNARLGTTDIKILDIQGDGFQQKVLRRDA